MVPPAVGTGTLRRLSELKTSCHPVLSAYLGLECTRSTSAAARERELDGLMTDMDRWTVEADVDRLTAASTVTGSLR